VQDLGRRPRKLQFLVALVLTRDTDGVPFRGWPMWAVDPGFQAWALPSSLAVTKGITVVFFSSPY